MASVIEPYVWIDHIRALKGQRGDVAVWACRRSCVSTISLPSKVCLPISAKGPAKGGGRLRRVPMLVNPKLPLWVECEHSS